jgi:hypothetical protein
MKLSKIERPLIAESLVTFYRRMKRAFRRPPSKEAIAISKLSRVVELHHRAARATWAAAEQLDQSGQEQLQKVCAEETRLALAVGDFVIELGGSPPRADESLAELPRESDEMAHASDQGELMGFVRENIDFVTNSHLEMARSPEIPSAMRGRLATLVKDGAAR